MVILISIVLRQNDDREFLVFDYETKSCKILNRKDFFAQEVWGYRVIDKTKYAIKDLSSVYKHLPVICNFELKKNYRNPPYVLIYKLKNLGRKDIFCVSDSMGNMKFCTSEEVRNMNMTIGFTNIIKSDKVIKANRDLIPCVEEDYLKRREDESKVLDIDDKNEMGFNLFIDNPNSIVNEILKKDIFRDKMSIRESICILDENDLEKSVLNFVEKPYMTLDKCAECKRCMKILQDQAGKKNFEQKVLNLFGSQSFLEYPCSVCEQIQNILNMAHIKKNSVPGMVNINAPYKMNFSMHSLSENLNGVQLLYHEYSHYLSTRDRKSGYIASKGLFEDALYKRSINFNLSRADKLYIEIFEFFKKNLKDINLSDVDMIDYIINFFTCLTEGFTEIVSGFFVFKNFERLDMKQKDFIKNPVTNKPYKLFDVRRNFSPYTFNMKKIDDILVALNYDNKGKGELSYMFESPYYENMIAMVGVSNELGIYNVFKWYFKNSILEFWKNLINEDSGEYLKLCINKFYFLSDGRDITFDLHVLMDFLRIFNLRLCGKIINDILTDEIDEIIKETGNFKNGIDVEIHDI